MRRKHYAQPKKPKKKVKKGDKVPKCLVVNNPYKKVGGSFLVLIPSSNKSKSDEGGTKDAAEDN